MTGSQMRIAYILTPITFGGAEKVSLNFLRNVDRKNMEIQPIILVRPWEEETFLGRELRQMGYGYQTVPVALNPENDPLRVSRVLFRLYSYLKEGNYDLVHTHGYFADICGQMAARVLRVRGISTCHGFIDTDTKLRLYNRLDKLALRLCRRVIAVSETIKADLIRSGLRSSNIAVIPNAVSPITSKAECAQKAEQRSRLGIAGDETVVGYMGRLSAEKGVTYLLDAVKGTLAEGRRVRLVVVGDGPSRKILEQQAESKGLSDCVSFVGFQTEPENWYPAFDIFVLPSLAEGTPMALLESMASGIPVVASAVGGVSKIVTDGVNGFLVPPGAPSAITEKIIALHGDSELATRLGSAGKEMVNKEFNIGAWCRRIERCYTEVLHPLNSSISKKFTVKSN